MKSGVIKAKEAIGNSLRLDPSFFLSEGVKVRSQLHRSPLGLTQVSECSEKVFFGNIFSRIWVKDAEHGVPYLAASDTVLSKLDTGNFLSKKQASLLSYLRLHKDWILVTCSGTIGNVTYTHGGFERYIATHDLIRVVPNDNKILRGVLYAFLSGKYGFYQLTQSKYGGVVKHISDKYVESIDIPYFDDEFQKGIDNLVRESAQLREEAELLLKQAHSIIESATPIHFVEKSGRIFNSHTTRLEGSYYTSVNRWMYDYLMSLEGTVPLKDCVSKIFRPGIFKREYVDNGITFLGGADIMLATPKSDKQLSFRQVNKMPELRVKKGWILVTCGGTIGNSVFVDNQISQCAISQHVMRIVPKDEVNSEFLYAYLSSQIGYKLITLFTYGSVIPSLEPHHLELVPIPRYDSSIIEESGSLVARYAEKLELAKEKEQKAISLVEGEIESWSK